MTHAVVVGGVLLSVINFYVDSSGIHGDVTSNTCEEDHQCHSNEFCFLETHACATCYNCTSYNRKPSEGKSCSKEPLDCGKCMEGYKADRLTTGREREYCDKIDQDKQLPIEEVMHIKPWIIGTIGGLCVLILIIVIIIIALVIRYKRKRKPPRSQENVENGEDQNGEERNYQKPLLQNAVKQENEEAFGVHTPSAPPPYESQIVPNLDTRNVHSEKQMATPFLFPDFPYYDEGAPSVDSDEVSEHEMPEEVDQEFHDADTLDAWSEDEVPEGAVNINDEETTSTPRCISETEVFENAVASSQIQNDSGISQSSSVVTSTRSLNITEEVDDGGQPSRKRPRNDSGTHTSEINISSDINSQSQEDGN